MTGAANPRIELFPQFIAYLEPDASPGEDESNRSSTGTSTQAGRHIAVSIMSSIGLSLSPGGALWQHVLSVEASLQHLRRYRYGQVPPGPGSDQGSPSSSHPATRYGIAELSLFVDRSLRLSLKLPPIS